MKNNINNSYKKEISNVEFILENIDMGFVIGYVEDDMNIKYINKTALNYMGYTLDEFKDSFNSKVDFCIHPEDREKLALRLCHSLSENEVMDYNIRVIDKEGETIILSGKLSSIVSSSGEKVWIYAFNNITNEKKIGDELRISEERFRIAFSQTNNIIFDYNVNSKTIEFLEGSVNPYGLDTIVYNVPKYLVEKEIVQKESIVDFISMVDKVDSGVSPVSCVAKFKLLDGGFAWNRISITSIFNEDGKPYKGIGIIEDVTIEKEIEQKYQQEEKYRNAMLSEAIVIYEANITKNEIINGFSYWKEQYGIDNISKYDKMILKIAEIAVHRDDIKQYLEHYMTKNIIPKYSSGIDELTIEYRRLAVDGEYHWVSCTTHIVRDPLTRDVISFSYLKDIDEKKKLEISLKYEAERDLLTDLYNKKTTERLISTMLEESDENSLHAFMIVDLDDFKSVNDNYGHVFGDAVLSEIGHKLKDMFRTEDIVGRIGGDEFIVCLKNIKSIETCKKKAEAICKIFRSANQGNELFMPSGTVGISLYPEHGKSFLDLYEKSDSALYFAKHLGKNQYFFYDSIITSDETINAKSYDEEAEFKKNFENNISEYVFKILYHAKDLKLAVESILKLLCIHFGVSRGYIFEKSKDGRSLSNTFEWCGASIESQKENLQNLDYDTLGDYDKHFKSNNIYIVEDINGVSQEEKQILEPQGIKSMLQCAIRYRGNLKGFIGFDDCTRVRIPTKYEMSTVQTVAEILGTFLMIKRDEEEAKESEMLLKKVMDNLDTYNYVINPRSYEILFANKKTTELVKNLKLGDLCYKRLRGKNAPCEDCPIKMLRENKGLKFSYEIFNDSLNVWTETTASYIKWTNEDDMCLLSCVDISKFKNA